MKKSLVISDKEKYGPSSPMVSSVSDKPSKPEDRKSAPTLELTGPQVEAFGLEKATIGDKGEATIHFVVKSVRAGEDYGDALSTNPKPKKVTIQILACEPSEDGEYDEDDEEDDEGEEDEDSDLEKAEEESGEDLDGDDEEGESAEHKAKVKGKKKKPAAEKDAESATSERVSPAEADLP